MHYVKKCSGSALALFFLAACGRPETLTANPSYTNNASDANITYAYDPQDSNIRVVVHVNNNQASGHPQDANAIAQNQETSATQTTSPPPAPEPSVQPTPSDTPLASPVPDASVTPEPSPTPTWSATPTPTDTPAPIVTSAPAPAPTPTADGTQVSTQGAVSTQRYLVADGNRLTWNDGTAWQGRGANIQDARGCGACLQTDLTQSTQEVLRRIDVLTDDWHANFLRLTLESDSTPDILQNANYLKSVATIVEHVMQKPNVVLEVSLWIDPSFNNMGWPTAQTSTTWQKLVRTIGQHQRVMFGIVNEPQYNSDGSLDGNVWTAMNQVAQSIRDQEAASGFISHVIVAQGTGGWARYLQYYTTHPLTAGDGKNFAYEVHVYDAASTFDARFVNPSKKIPVIIGEFGPAAGAMTMQDCTTLMNTADALGVPYMGWTAHMRCPPSMLEDNSENSCGIGMPLDPTPWGQLLIDHLAANPR